MIKITLTAAGLGLMLAATPAAASDEGLRKAHVEYRDLNLATPEGLERLERRVDSAARKACGFNEERTGTRIPSPDRIQCYQKARANADRQVALAIISAQRGG